MLSFIAKLTMARAPKAAPQADIQQLKDTAPGEVAAPAGGYGGKPLIPIFINPKTLQVPILVGLVKGAWEATKALPASTASTYLTSTWFPFAACTILGILITVSNLREDKAPALMWIVGLIIGFLNSMVVFGAVMGITR